jgi:hypothetical protein
MILLNNRIYGLTKGQYSPTSARGFVSKSSPYGTVEDPFTPAELCFGARGRFFARCVATDMPVAVECQKAGLSAWLCFTAVICVLIAFSVCYAGDCVITLGQSTFDVPWLLWVADALFAGFAVLSLRNSRQMFILNLLMFTIVFMVI